jgi:ABC-type multidrug transport system fused ATPase/permease subunit
LGRGKQGGGCMSVNSVKDDEYLKSVSKKNTLLRLFKYLLAYKLPIAGVLLIMLVTVAISIINPLIIERAIDVNIKNRDFKGLLILGGFAVAINLLFVALVKIRMYLMAKISNKVLLTIRQELYTHIQKLSFNFFDSRPTGKILARIIGDVNSLKDVLSNSVTTLIPDFITICAVVVIMLVKNWRLALASLISLPFMMFGLWFIQTRSHLRWQLFRKKSSNLNAFIHEDLSGMRIIQSYTAEDETGENFDVLLKEAEESSAGSKGVVFLPYLMGERTPHSDPNAKGTFIGLNMTNKRGDMTRAILEGVCFGLRDSLEILKDMKIPVKCARVSGGGAKSRLWRQILADTFNTDVEIINSEEGPAFGGAILASVGCGLFGSVDEACRSLIKVTDVVKPQAENVQKYNRVYKVYTGMYDILKNTFTVLSEI